MLMLENKLVLLASHVERWSLWVRGTSVHLKRPIPQAPPPPQGLLVDFIDL